MKRREILVLFFIFAFALTLRLNYISSITPSPVYNWNDEGCYNDTAKSIYGILSHFNIFTREFLNGRLGKGKGVLDSYGLSLPFGIFHRGIIHHLFIAFIYLVFGIENFRAVWIAHGIIDSLSCILVYLIGSRIFSKKIALAASILTAIYLPFIQYNATLMQETLIIFLLLSTIFFFVKAIQEKAKMSFFLGSFCLFLITTGRAAYMYWFLILFIGLFYIFIKEKDIVPFRRAVFGLTLGFLIPLLMWMSLVYLELGKFGKIMGGADGIVFYTSNIISLQGWQTDEDRLGLGPHMKEELKKMGFAWDEKNRKWPPDNILKRATLNEIHSDPLGFLCLVVYRIRMLWYGNACDAKRFSSFQ